MWVVKHGASMDESSTTTDTHILDSDGDTITGTGFDYYGNVVTGSKCPGGIGTCPDAVATTVGTVSNSWNWRVNDSVIAHEDTLSSKFSWDADAFQKNDSFEVERDGFYFNTDWLHPVTFNLLQKTEATGDDDWFWWDNDENVIRIKTDGRPTGPTDGQRLGLARPGSSTATGVMLWGDGSGAYDTGTAVCDRVDLTCRAFSAVEYPSCTTASPPVCVDGQGCGTPMPSGPFTVLCY
jgi:hypothetical protein